MPIKRLLEAKNIRLFSIIYTLGITVLMVIPVPEQQQIDVPNLDKWVHTLVYVLFSSLWLWAYQAQIQKKSVLFWIITTSVLVYGIVIEIVQGNFIPSRSFDLLDIAANSLGILIGGWFFRRFKKYRKV